MNAYFGIVKSTKFNFLSTDFFISIKASMSRLRISHYCPYSEALLALSLRRAFP